VAKVGVGVLPVLRHGIYCQADGRLPALNSHWASSLPLTGLGAALARRRHRRSFYHAQ